MANPTKEKYWLFILAVLNVIVIAVMQSFSTDLKPYTIIGFEFALTPENAQLMVSAWRENGVLNSVYFVTGFDYLFMVAYSAFLWLACMQVGNGMSQRLMKAFQILAWLQPVAAVLDAVENLSLFQILAGSLKLLWPTLAAACAAPKFAFVVLAIISCVVGLLYKTFKK